MHKEVHSMVYDINERQAAQGLSKEFFETDFSFEIPKLARFRVNAFNQKSRRRCRISQYSVSHLSLDELNAPKSFKDLCMLPRVSCWSPGRPAQANRRRSPAWSIIAMTNRPDHIITIEDPIEFVHESKRCLVNQREVHRDTLGFSEALPLGAARRPRCRAGG